MSQFEQLGCYDAQIVAYGILHLGTMLEASTIVVSEHVLTTRREQALKANLAAIRLARIQGELDEDLEKGLDGEDTIPPGSMDRLIDTRAAEAGARAGAAAAAARLHPSQRKGNNKRLNMQGGRQKQPRNGKGRGHAKGPHSKGPKSTVTFKAAKGGQRKPRDNRAGSNPGRGNGRKRRPNKPP